MYKSDRVFVASIDAQEFWMNGDEDAIECQSLMTQEMTASGIPIHYVLMGVERQYRKLEAETAFNHLPPDLRPVLPIAAGARVYGKTQPDALTNPSFCYAVRHHWANNSDYRAAILWGADMGACLLHTARTLKEEFGLDVYVVRDASVTQFKPDTVAANYAAAGIKVINRSQIAFMDGVVAIEAPSSAPTPPAVRHRHRHLVS